MESIELLYVMNWGGREGAGRQAKLLIPYFHREKDIDLKLLHPVELDSDQKLIETETNYGVPLYYTNNLKEAIEKIEPDILFIHSFAPYIVGVAHKLRLSNFKGKIVYRDGTNILEQYLVYLIDRRAYSIVATIMFQEFDMIICPSKFVADQVSFLLPDDVKVKLAYIPVAVETSAFVPTKYKGETITSSGRLEVVNPYIFPLNAFRRLKTEFPHIRFKILGDGTFRALYEEAVRNYKLSNVEIKGWLPTREVYRELELSDIFVQPSITQNGVPNSVLEAMAAGCVCIVSDHPGIEVNSVIKVRLEDFGSWYQALRKVITDHDFAKKVIKSQFQEVANYDVERIIKVYVDVFKGILQ